ncbi:hypothetical protein [Bacillus sp. V2I10]|uniref:hypothetical protein n=1 Tax=Bacillus sp. V2I10 TaxID=3042276 RepID=UPI0027848B6A|nr:hypothetical protein [Bacillus sp. V2I10]MDQ0862401.1 hypothetical protein [Bacillus sp. V2I10]
MKKLLNIGMIVTLVVGLFFAITPTTLAGGWDHQGSDEFTNSSEIFLSGGGDFKICLSSDSQSGHYQLFEEDPYNPDDEVYSNDGTLGLTFNYTIPGDHDFDKNGCYVFKNISGYVDGDQAEFYLEKYSGGNSFVTAWD